jgi:hypothetical protein
VIMEDKTYSITVKWPSAQRATVTDFSEEAARNWADFLWICGADDVIVRCECGECETCYDRAIYMDCE